ncbi:serine/threonine-protein kinase [Actinomadura mexicana]|uniref:Serine/threonine protein kinase n=1 Tax=Actinomadura mexicana TaxID=134959 RepID=A0A238X689_9ACTN|nr:serine/threonine-protein kinase [Actinomadura mexicana]SNR54546.1 Serine/threonine protein kinase [Actinomadura mexicana]
MRTAVDALRPGDPRAIGRYTLSARLGAGGMGQVFLGSSPGGRPVAVKLVHPGFAADAEFRRRFKREVEAARRVGGFHTAPVVDADPEADIPWLVTAYVPGPSLATAVAEHGPFPPVSAFALGAGLAEALEAVHGAGVVHRDLKPSNVLLAADGPRVIDFGIARAVDASGVTALAGTPGFMAPELISEGEITPACDVFALGAVLAYALGVRPFGEGPVEALTYRVVHKSPVLDALPAPLQGVVADCLAKDPAARPSPGELVEVLSSTGESGAWLPPPVHGMLTRYHVTGTSTTFERVDDVTGPFEGDKGLLATQRPGRYQSVRFEASIPPVVLALVGYALRLLLGIALGIVALRAAIESADSGGAFFALVLAVLAVVAFWLVRVPLQWLSSQLNALFRPCELQIGADGLDLRYSGRRVHYGWHEIGRVVVRRAKDAGWAVCVFPLLGTPLPAVRGPRTPLCYLERKTGWIMVVPVYRLKGSRKEIEMTLARYAGARWGGNA